MVAIWCICSSECLWPLRDDDLVKQSHLTQDKSSMSEFPLHLNLAPHQPICTRVYRWPKLLGLEWGSAQKWSHFCMHPWSHWHSPMTRICWIFRGHARMIVCLNLTCYGYKDLFTLLKISDWHPKTYWHCPLIRICWWFRGHPGMIPGMHLTICDIKGSLRQITQVKHVKHPWSRWHCTLTKICQLFWGHAGMIPVMQFTCCVYKYLMRKITKVKHAALHPFAMPPYQDIMFFS